MKGTFKMGNYTKYEIKSGTRWHVQGYLGLDEFTGKQVNYNKRGFKTKKEARLAYSRAKVKFEECSYGTQTNKNILYSEVYQEWLEHYKKEVRASTLNKVLQIFRDHILPKLGHLRINKLTHLHLQKAVNHWHSIIMSYKRIYNYALRVIDYAIKMGYIKDNPKNRVFVPKETNLVFDKKTKDFYDREELQEFMKALEQEESRRWHAYFRLLAFTGMRRGEALALTWGDIDFKNMTVCINKTLAQGIDNELIINEPKTKGSERTISVDAKTLQVLKLWRAEQVEKLLSFGFNAMKPTQYLFTKYYSNDFLNDSAPRNALVRICDKHGLEMINVHGFRHTHCTLLFESGVHIKDVMERLGHSDIETTMEIYTHITNDSREKSAEKFAQYVQF